MSSKLLQKVTMKYYSFLSGIYFGDNQWSCIEAPKSENYQDIHVAKMMVDVSVTRSVCKRGTNNIIKCYVVAGGWAE